MFLDVDPKEFIETIEIGVKVEVKKVLGVDNFKADKVIEDNENKNLDNSLFLNEEIEVQNNNLALIEEAEEDINVENNESTGNILYRDEFYVEDDVEEEDDTWFTDEYGNGVEESEELEDDEFSVSEESEEDAEDEFYVPEEDEEGDEYNDVDDSEKYDESEEYKDEFFVDEDDEEYENEFYDDVDDEEYENELYDYKENEADGDFGVADDNIFKEDEELPATAQDKKSEEQEIKQESKSTFKVSDVAIVEDKKKEVYPGVEFYKGMSLVEFLRKNPSKNSINDVLLYFSKQEVQNAIDKGEVFSKKGKLII